MGETSKAKLRWVASGEYQHWIEGKKGIDIGCGRMGGYDYDTIAPEPDCVHHDYDICDAVTMDAYGVEEFDYVWASHILEHLNDPIKAICRWYNMVKPGGILVIAVPHRDLYEMKRMLPSNWNLDHKTMWLPDSVDPPNTFSLADVIGRALGEPVEVSVTKEDAGWCVGDNGHAGGEYSIEAVIYK